MLDRPGLGFVSRRKRSRPAIAETGELRVGTFRFSRDIAGDEAKIIAIGVKQHSDLYIRG